MNLRCDWYINPFEVEENKTGKCDMLASEQMFRRKHDGFVKFEMRCEEHSDLCNEQWEHVKLPK